MRTIHYHSYFFWNVKSLFVFLFLVATNYTFSQVNIEVEKTNATYEVGDTIIFKVSATSGGNVSWSLKYDMDAPLISSGSFPVPPNQTKTISHITTEPGVIVCEVVKQGNVYSAAAAVSPFEIAPFTTEPTDFDSFWEGKKNELAAVPINPVITFHTTNQWSKTYQVEFDNIDNRTVYGYMVVPNGTGPFPAMVEMPPYGSVAGIAVPGVSLAEQAGVIVISITIHNSPPNQPAPNAYQPDNFANENDNYYRWGILAGIRAIDYLVTRSDLDGGNIGVCGVSQGAGLSAILAGLDDRVKLLAMSNPVLCQNAGLVHDRAGGFPNYIQISRTVHGTQVHETATIDATRYYDAMFHARRFDGLVYANFGYKDLVTPAATGFAAINQFGGKKIVQHSFDLGHEHPQEYWSGRQNLIRRLFPISLTSHSFPWASNDQGYWIDAGDDQTTNLNTVDLTATIEKNGSVNSSFDLLWKKLSGPGNVTFTAPHDYTTTATFTTTGTYVLEFSGVDETQLAGEKKFSTLSDRITVTIGGTGNTPPSVTISTDSLTVTVPFEVEVEFSEPVTSFDLSDIDLTNGVASNLAGMDSLYTFDVTPTADGLVELFIESLSVIDNEGAENPNPSNSLSINYSAPSNGNCNTPTNLALGKTATQSGTQVNAEADRAIDGNTNGNFWVSNSVTFTNWVSNAWWEVDLLSLSDINEIRVWNRTDCCDELFADFYILVSNTPFISQDLNTTLNQSGVSSYFISGSAGYPTSEAINTTGRFVRIQLSGAAFLAIAEVEIMGCIVNGGTPLNQTISFDPIQDKLTVDAPFSISATATSALPVDFSIVSGPATVNNNIITLDGTPGTVVVRASQAGNANYNPAPDVDQSFEVTEPQVGSCTVISNMALNKPSSQSGTQLNGVASRVNDGNTDGNFWTGNSVNLTNWIGNAWWDVDLQTLSNIETINVWNRSDCCSDKLSDFYIFVSDVPFTSQDLNGTINQSEVSSFLINGEAGFPSAININRTGRFVRVQLTSASFLTMAEVEVMGCPDTAGGLLNQTIAFDPIDDKLTTDTPFDISATADSGLPVDLTILSGPATISGNTITLDGIEGIVVVRASQAGNANFNPALDVDQSFEVTLPPPALCTSTSNIALGKTATQSGTQVSAEADRAIDGETDGNFWVSNSVSLTNWVSNSWWEVDLDSVQNIDEINLWNRTDCCTDKFSDFYVFVSDVPFTSTDLNTTLSQAGVDNYFVSGEAGYPTNLSIVRTGRYVRVQLSGAAFLAIAEVEIMGCEIPSNNVNTLFAQPDILEFEVKKNQREAQFTWATNTEYENDFFTIEKSKDGQHFEELHSIESQSDALGFHFYQDVDEEPFLGKNYYRLMRAGKNGVESYSEIRAIDFEIDLNEFAIFPNPANENLFVNLKPFLGKKIQMQIFDAQGVLMSEKNIAENFNSLQSFDLNDFENGLYTLKIKIEGIKMLTRQFVVVRPY